MARTRFTTKLILRGPSLLTLGPDVGRALKKLAKRMLMAGAEGLEPTTRRLMVPEVRFELTSKQCLQRLPYHLAIRTSLLLYRLSYTPKKGKGGVFRCLRQRHCLLEQFSGLLVATRRGLEPLTSAVTGRRSTLLN